MHSMNTLLHKNNKTIINQLDNSFKEKRYWAHNATSLQIYVHLPKEKADIDREMIEVFYHRLLPVTRHTWGKHASINNSNKAK